jgi:hypothetical protein
MNWHPKSALAALAGALIAFAAQADEGSRWDDGIGFYVGIDSRITFPSGTYAGQYNPNAGRLTLLFDHGNHFHGIGTYSLSGPASAPVTLPTSTNNRIPETYTGLASIPLHKGSGAFAGTWVSKVLPDTDPAHEYSYLGIASIQSLDGLSPMADVLFHSSGDRWSAHYQNNSVALKLLSATPGLKVAAGGMMDIFGGGDTYKLGPGDSFEFLPTYYVDQGASPGLYSAKFMLVNLGSNANARPGGEFHFDFSVPTPVPEPGTWALFGAGLLALAWTARRRAGSAR